MALDPKLRELLREVVKSGQIKSLEDVRNIVKDITKDVLQDTLEAELSQHLGYDKYDHEMQIKENYRNGKYSKKVKSQSGEMSIDIPRDRNGTFEPQIIEKYQSDISDLENKIIALYSRGVSNRDIEESIKDMYGIKVDATLVSKITDRILPKITEWQNRPLDKVYAMIFIDGIRFKVREENQIVEKSVYIVMGYNLEDYKDVLGFWISESETSKYLLNVLNDLKMRGLQDILIVSCDNLPGVSEAISSVFPKTDIQKCIVHQIRNSVKFVNYKDLKEFTQDIKKIYNSVNLENSELALNTFEEKWGKKYQYATKSWRANFQELATFYEFPIEIRKLIYTTNVIENLNRNIRKISKNKTSFPTENSLSKVVYFAIQNQPKKWEKSVPNWGATLSQLNIIFEDRI